MSGDILVPELRDQKGHQIDAKLDLWKYFEIAWLYDHIRFVVCLVCMWRQYEIQFGENCMAKNGWFGIYRSETAKMAKIETFPDISQNEEIRSSWFSELGTQIVSLKNSVMISSIIPDLLELILAAWLFVCLQIQFCMMLSLKFIDPELFRLRMKGQYCETSDS